MNALYIFNKEPVINITSLKTSMTNIGTTDYLPRYHRSNLYSPIQGYKI